MRFVGLTRGLALFLVASGLLGALGWFWWSATQRADIAFLPQQDPAGWVVYPSAASLVPRPDWGLATVFKRSFRLDTPLPEAALRIAAFRRYSVTINGTTLGGPRQTGRSWKRPDVFDVSGQLRAGQNELTVTVCNSNGPPALWLALEAKGLKVVSDESWQCSYAEAAWRSARLATKPKLVLAGSAIGEGETPWTSLRANWPALALFLGLVAAICWFALINTPLQRGAAWWRELRNRFNGFSRPAETVETVSIPPLRPNTPLKQGVNERAECWALSRFSPVLEWLRRRDLVPAAMLAVLWVALFANNIGELSPRMGYDAQAHLEYIQYVTNHHALPLAAQGWEMFQPPLYYVLAAALLGVLGLPVTGPGALVALRLMGLGIGVAHFLAAWASFRLLFPGARAKQLWALVLAALLPPLFYISHYVSNEGLAAALVSVAFFLALRILNQSRPSWRAYAGLGACLGAALLTKSTALLAVPPIIGGLVWKGVFRGQSPQSTVLSPQCKDRSQESGVRNQEENSPNSEVRSPKAGAGCGGLHWAAGVGLALIACLGVCGWHYARVWMNYGTPLIAVWDPRTGFTWWQDDGYRTSTYYLRFGEALRHPWFGSLHSFSDGLYSTLWGDGLFGGNLGSRLDRTPWNYGLMAVGYWLALAPTAALLAGSLVMVLRFLRRPSAQLVMVLGLGFLVGVALVQIGLSVPYYCNVKMFYGLAALVPLCACGAEGVEFLSSRHRGLRLLLSAWLGLWAVNGFASFWILHSSAPVRLLRAQSLIREGRLPQALHVFQELLKAEPQNLEARSMLISVLTAAGQDQPATELAETIERDNPSHAGAHLALSALLSGQGRMAAATEHARRALDLAPGNPRPYEHLATLLTEQGYYAEAGEIARQGLAVAPLSPELRLALGCAWLAAGDTNAAAQWQLAFQLKPGWGEGYASVATVLAKAGHFDQATAMACKARELALAQGEQGLAQRCQEMIGRFTERKPFREPAPR